MPVCPICCKNYTRLRKHHWFPKRLVRKLEKSNPQMYAFLMAFILEICRACEEEVHPENEWHEKINVKLKESKRYIDELQVKRKSESSYIINLRNSLSKANKQIVVLNQKISDRREVKEINELQGVIIGKKRRIEILMKEVKKKEAIEKELARYKSIVKNMRKKK